MQYVGYANTQDMEGRLASWSPCAYDPGGHVQLYPDVAKSAEDVSLWVLKSHVSDHKINTPE